MNKQSTVFQVITTIGTRFFVLFGAFIVSVITARLLGPEGKGIITALLVIPTIVIALADLGIRQSTAFFIGKKTYEDKEITSTLSFVWVVSSLLCMAVVGCIYYFQYGQKYDVWLLFIFLLIIPVNLGMYFLRGIMQGKLRIGTINTSEIVKTTLNFLLIILLVGLWKFGVLGAALTQFGMALFTLFYCIRALKDMKFGFKFNYPVFSAMIRKGFTFALALFVLQLNYRFSIVMLESMTNATEVGIYSVGMNIAEIIWQLPAAIGLILFSKGANAKKDMQSIQRTMKFIRFLVPVLIVCGLCFWIFAPFIIGILFGQAFIEAAGVIRYLMPGILTFVIVKLLHSEISGRGYPLFSLNVSVISLILNVVMNLIFIPSYGAIGASISTAVSYTFGAVLFVILYSKREKVKIADMLILQKSDIGELKGLRSRLRGKLKKREGQAVR